MIAELRFGDARDTGWFTVNYSTVSGPDPIYGNSSRQVLSGSYRTYTDWKLYLNYGWDLTPPEVQTNYIDIPGRNGSVDASESLTNTPVYKDRTFTANVSCWDTYENMIALHRSMVNLLHGTKTPIYLDPYSDGDYLMGRVSVGMFKYDYMTGEAIIPITARCEPFWYLDQLTSVTQSGSGTVTLTNAKKTVIPVITIDTDGTALTFNGSTFTLNAGTWRIADIYLLQGTSEIVVNTTGTVKFEYQEGVL
jgi:phage-related protein